MKTEEEVRAAAQSFAWYVASGRVRRQDRDTQNNITGTIAALEWFLKSDAEDPNSPISGCLRDIAEMQKADQNKNN